MELFKITHRDPHTKARAGVLTTAHGEMETPVFMAVGTQATVKTMGAHEIKEIGYKKILANTYHLFLRPGLETLLKAGGLHQFMGWDGSILTDSGGYQVFSLATRCKMSEVGVEFSSHVDGARHMLSPEITTRFQLDIGSDIAMALDECPPYPSLEADAKKGMDLTIRWAKRCRSVYDDWLKEKGVDRSTPHPLYFGLLKATFPDLRKESAFKTAEVGFPGYAIGGLGVGEPKKLTWSLLEASIEPLPDLSPHYMMGFGQPEDFWDGVERGVDMFDCVLPTRNGRNGQAFTSVGKVNITNAKHKEDFSPLDPKCRCTACQKYTKGYLCHLFKANELLGPRLLTLHNLSFMLDLLKTIRKSIIEGTFREEKEKFLSQYGQTNSVPL